jgi:hypothetical protein
MMMKLRFVLSGLIFCVHAHAATVVDVYGVSPEVSKILVQKYGKRVADIMVPLNEQVKKMPFGVPFPKELEHLAEQREAIIEEIKKKEGLIFVNLEEVLYTDEPNHYVTMDVVTSGHQERLRFIHPATPEKTYPKTNDIIDKMSEYTHLVFQRIISNKVPQEMKCPVYHCLLGFDDRELKPYLALFNTAAVKQRKLIIDTLNHDENPARRASAAFLVGHFKDPKDIVAVTLPHVNDPDETVRNNVIRVIASTLSTSKIKTVDGTPFLELLDSPSITDRNKSLYVLDSIAESKAGKKLLIQQGAERLMANYQLKQPNNHEPAYRILKTLSGRDFGEHNAPAWQAWFKLAQSAKG